MDVSDEGREINEEESEEDEDEETEEEGDEVEFEETIPQKSRRKCPSYEHLFEEEQSEQSE